MYLPIAISIVDSIFVYHCKKYLYIGYCILYIYIYVLLHIVWALVVVYYIHSADAHIHILLARRVRCYCWSQGHFGYFFLTVITVLESNLFS